MKCWYGSFALLACFASVTLAQEPPKPGKEHEFLKRHAGVFEAKMAVAPGQPAMVGKHVSKMGLGGLWLMSEFEMDMMGTKFEGHGLDSYDPVKKKFVSVWVDSMTTSPLHLEGDLSADGKTLTYTGKGPGPDGKPTDYKSVSEYKSDDEYVFKMWMGALEGDPMMTITYTRVKK